MKKIFIPILSLSLLLFAACGSKPANVANAGENDSVAVAENTENAESSDDVTDGVAASQTKEGAKAFVEAVYKTYLNPTAEDEKKLDDAEITLFGMAYMDKYMSDKLQAKIVEANDKQIEDDIVFFESDVWTNSQDNAGFKVKEVNNVEFTGESATLEVILTNGSAETKVYPIIEYNKEKNRWFVRDFYVSGKKFLRIIEDFLDDDM